MKAGYMQARARSAQEIPELIAASLTSHKLYLMLMRQEITMTIKESLRKPIGQFQKTIPLKLLVTSVNDRKHLLRRVRRMKMNIISG